MDRRLAVVVAVFTFAIAVPGCGSDAEQENALLLEENEALRARLAALQEDIGHERRVTVVTPVTPETPPPPVSDPAPPASAPRRYVVRSGDTLTRIAQEMYGDRSRWPDIYDANRAVIGDDQDRLKVGQSLAIPPRPVIAASGRR